MNLLKFKPYRNELGRHVFDDYSLYVSVRVFVKALDKTMKRLYQCEYCLALHDTDEGVLSCPGCRRDILNGVGRWNKNIRSSFERAQKARKFALELLEAK
jgi:hypothetical protein